MGPQLFEAAGQRQFTPLEVIIFLIELLFFCIGREKIKVHVTMVAFSEIYIRNALIHWLGIDLTLCIVVKRIAFAVIY